MIRARNFLYTILFFGIFLAVVYFTPPPKSWADASIFQILSFFLPLVLFLTFLIYLFSHSFGKSFPISLGVMVILVLSSINELNLISLSITLGLTVMLVIFFQRVGLTKTRRIPKLTRFRRRK